MSADPQIVPWSQPKYLAHHVVRAYDNPDCTGTPTETLFWGDDVLGAISEGGKTRFLLTGDRIRWAKGDLELLDVPPLALLFLDVGQGDACLITTPDGARILIDGGENKLAARYLAQRYRHETAAGAQVLFDAVVVTHGDADHFEGLSILVLDAAEHERKHVRFATKRVYHNGLVKRPVSRPDGSARSEREMLGPSVQLADGSWAVSELIDDPRTLPDTELNKHFQRWKTALEALAGRHPLEVRRIDDTSIDAFDFVSEVKIEILGPRTTQLADKLAGLKMMGVTEGGAPSSAKTINGHSITLKLTYGRARILLTGDLTKESADALLSLHKEKHLDLVSEVLKVPHHGSSDYSIPFLTAVHPAVSIISAGDENTLRDHMHPRANVVGALGKAGRGDEPLIFVTNLSAFDAYAGPAFRAKKMGEGLYTPDSDKPMFYARERIVYGRIFVRTDGEQLFIARMGAKGYEAYVFQLSEDSTPMHTPLMRL